MRTDILFLVRTQKRVCSLYSPLALYYLCREYECNESTANRMKEFFRLLRRFIPPYKKYLIGALFLNLLSAILNIFSFALIIPILQILFKMDTKTYEFIPWDTAGVGLKDVAVNNFYYYVTEMIASQGGSLTLLILGIFLAVMTLFKAFSYFASSAVMIPLRTCLLYTSPSPRDS